MSRLLFFLLACLTPISSALFSADNPNIIVILIDDQGYYDLGCYGATEVKTPHIDRLADEGIRFTDYYAAAPICSPSRAGLLTGSYPRRIGMETWVQRADSRRGIHPDEVTLAELFRDHGYATACVGKWHLGDKPPFLPNAQGFGSYFGLLHNLDAVETIHFAGRDGPGLWRNDEIVQANVTPGELTARYTDEAIAFIREKKDVPFFLYLPHTMLHEPLGVSPEFQGSSSWGDYGDAIQELDHHVGRLMNSLDEAGIADNTIVVYTSDNGRGPGRTPDQPMQGRKLTTWEAGIRVPAIVSGPGIKKGATRSEVVSALDWYPTLASLAGITIPEDHPVIDGRDLSPELTGLDDIGLNHRITARRRWDPPLEWAPLISREEYQDAFFFHGSHGELVAVRSGKWKLFLNPAPTLYDLEADPGESKPVRQAETLRRLRGMAVLFQEEMSREARKAGEWTDKD